MLLPKSSTSSTHVEVELLVVATTTASTTKRSSSATEETREDVVKVHVMELASTWLSLHLFMLSHALFTLLVIYSTFFFVRQYFISVCNLLELLFRTIRVILVFVWMVLNC